MSQLSSLEGNTEGEKEWNFEDWLKQNHLHHIKNVFIENNMTTSQALTERNQNFDPILYDRRVVANSQLISKIFVAINLLSESVCFICTVTYLINK